ncbi:MAG TPA: DUF72 domain-containing protein [Dehalococcoidia bacterium]|nr:DUF72 domain-containing protein [Dehalococcoidia bacterium]
MAATYHIGTSGWHYEHWRDIFYPAQLPKAAWLEFYARHFDTVELNNSFYRLPSEDAFGAWRDLSPPDFIFAVKASRFITHIKRLKNTEEALENFITRAKILGGKLGPILYQLPPNMHRNDGVLESFLSILPQGMKHVIEFRHASWLEEEVFEILRKYKVGLCVFDMPQLSCPPVATASFAYIRFHGSGELYSSCYPDEQLAGWAERIADLARNLEEVYIYFNNDVAGYALKNAETLRGYLMPREGK